jgi:hypothetical protein
MNHSTLVSLTLTVSLALSAAGCASKPRCHNSSRYSLTGALAPAAGPLSEGSVCSLYGEGPNSSTAQVYLWGDRDELRALMLRTRLAMRTQGWAEHDPNNEYFRAPEDSLWFRQGALQMHYQFRLTSYPSFGSKWERPAIMTHVYASVVQPRTRWR